MIGVHISSGFVQPYCQETDLPLAESAEAPYLLEQNIMIIYNQQ